MSSDIIGILNSTLNVNKKLIDIAMQNIANADDPKYSTKVVSTSSIVSGQTLGGVKIDMITSSNIDPLLEKTFYSANAKAASAQYIGDISKEVLDKLGCPGSNQGLQKTLSDFENAIIETSFNPTDIALRNNLQNKTDDLTKYIRNTANFIQEKRLDADIKLCQSLKEANAILSKIQQLNRAKLLCHNGSIEYCTLDDEIKYAMVDLSKYFDFSVKNSGATLANNGYDIVGKELYSFEYSPQNSIDDFINDKAFNKLSLVSRSLDGGQVNKTSIISDDKSSDLSYNVNEGLINGLLQVRDNYMPRLAETLDQLTLNIAQVFNTVHNSGCGSKSLKSLSGITEIAASDMITGSGHFIINPMDSYGRPMTRTGLGKIPAMNLDLNQFTNNGLAGSFNVAGIVNEINEYFTAASTGNRLDMNGFHTINMAVMSSDKDSGNNMKLDFDLISYSTDSNVSNMQFSISNVIALDSNGNNISAKAINPTGFNIDNGVHSRTGINGGPYIALSNNNSYPITIALDITTTVNSIDTISRVEYTINAPTTDTLNSLNGIVNKRFTPTNLLSSSDDKTQLLSSNYGQSIVKASIVNEGGIPVTGNNATGFLKIENLVKDCGIGINESDSILRSWTNPAINGGFSSAFSMNNAFVFKDGQSIISDPKNRKNIAAFIQLSDSLKASPNGFALGQMQEYRAGENSFNAPGIFYALGAGDTSLVKKYQDIKNQNIRFSETQDIKMTQTNIYDYAKEIFDFNNQQTVMLIQKANSYNEMQDMTHHKIMSLKNVDIDTEAMQIMQYQKNYSISAKFINTYNILIQSLLDNIH